MDDNNSETAGLSRRDFLLSCANIAILTSLGLFIGFPIVEIFSTHARKNAATAGFFDVAKLSELIPGEPLQKAVVATERDAWNKRDNVNMGSVWLIKTKEGHINAFSSICPHLGCIYAWNPDQKLFICPCHDSAFALDGRVIKGPAPRPLDSLDVKTQDGDVLVKYERFISGIEQKKVV